MLLTILYIIGITAEAMTGALAAGRQKMDLFGVIIIAAVTAIGGGSLRDILLGHYPLTWVKHPIYIVIICSAAILTIIIAPMMRHLKKIFLILDAVGLITFSILGAQVALEMGHGWIIACIAAVITGAFGGILRDTLCNTLPLVFQKEIYASISLLAALLYLGLLNCGVGQHLTVIITLLAGLFLRLLVIRYGWRLPIFNYEHYD